MRVYVRVCVCLLGKQMLSVMMYGALRCMRSRLPNVGLLSLQHHVSDHLSAAFASQRMFAIRTDFTETVYDNEDGGPKCRGIELLRDPNFNKVCVWYWFWAIQTVRTVILSSIAGLSSATFYLSLFHSTLSCMVDRWHRSSQKCYILCEI